MAVLFVAGTLPDWMVHLWAAGGQVQSAKNKGHVEKESHAFVARRLVALAGPGRLPGAAWRQVGGLLHGPRAWPNARDLVRKPYLMTVHWMPLFYIPLWCTMLFCTGVLCYFVLKKYRARRKGQTQKLS